MLKDCENKTFERYMNMPEKCLKNIESDFKRLREQTRNPNIYIDLTSYLNIIEKVKKQRKI